MLPSQTVYLRRKNEELLNDLKENARHLNRRVEICSDLLRQQSPYSAKEFTEHQCPSPEMSPIAKFNRRDRTQPVKILHSSHRHRSLSAGRASSSSTSGDRIRSSRPGQSSCVPSQPVSHGSSNDSRWSKFQQDLASNAHMHGYTLSHAMSKCYCTRKDGSDTGTSFAGTSRIIAESLPGKSRVPPRYETLNLPQDMNKWQCCQISRLPDLSSHISSKRLKEKRHQARSPNRRPGNVKWAVPNDKEATDLLPEEINNIRLFIEEYDQENNQKQSSFCGSSCAQDDAPIRTCVPTDEPASEHDPDWFIKMKNFRKSNWDDCHAPDRPDEEKSDCKCNRLFRVGERLFLEPIQTSVSNNDCCCSKPPRKNAPKPSKHDTLVTLPKLRSEAPEKNKEERAVLNERTGCISGTYNINGPCFLTGHKTRKDDDQLRAFVAHRPADSFALRYQKGVDPRRL